MTNGDKMKKQTMLIVLLIVMPLSATVAMAQEGDNTNDIEQLFESYFREMIEINPEYATHLGLSDEMGISYAKDELTNVAEAALNYELNLIRKYRARLQAVEREKLSDSQRLAYSILLRQLNNQLEGEEFRHHSYIINHIFGVHNSLTTLMTEYHTIESIEDAQNYISRLEKYAVKFDQLLEGLRIREQKGIMPPRVIIEKTTSTMSDFISVDVKDNVLYTSFVTRFIKLENIELTTKLKLYEQVKNNIEAYVYPSYQKFISHITKLQQKATDDAGVWSLHDGDRYYEYCLRTHTTTGLTAKEIHKIGLKEVKRIHKEMIKILKSIGVEKTTFYNMVTKYRRSLWREGSEQFYYPNTRTGRAQVLKDYQTIIDEVEQKLPNYFSVIPKTTVKVKAVPKFKQNTMGAHYSPASLDGKREGVFYANLTNLPFKPGMQTLTYHEAIPGHHFQFTIQRESAEIRLFRHLSFFTAYVEGWALYAEKLAMENGWYKNAHSKLGYLNSELLRAVRLVVDTGIHYKRWTRDKAYNYMLKNLGWDSYNSIDRYIVWPGQACAYKIGELKILELRNQAQKALRKRFDIKDFHRVVLQHGSVPLDILERLVQEYIKEGQAK